MPSGEQVHESIRSKLAYDVSSTQLLVEENATNILEEKSQIPPKETRASAPNERCTVAVAMLGSIAALGCWFGLAALELQALEDKTGHLAQYLRRLGFVESLLQSSSVVKTRPASGDSRRPWLEMPCSEVTRRYCPLAWREQLPPDGDLSALCSMVAVIGPEAKR